MSTTSPDDILAQWQADEAALRPRQQLEVGLASRAMLAGKTGLQQMQAMLDGLAPRPPISETLDFALISVTDGEAVFQGRPQFKHYNPLGSVHGGYFCTLLDSAVGCAVHSVLPQGLGYTTLELKVNLIRALTAKTGPVRAEGKVIQVGNRVGIAEGRIVDVDGKIYAHATTTCLVFPLP